MCIYYMGRVGCVHTLEMHVTRAYARAKMLWWCVLSGGSVAGCGSGLLVGDKSYRNKVMRGPTRTVPRAFF